MKAVQEHLGHTKITMTQRYAHLSKEYQAEEVNRLNGLCGEDSKKLVRSEQIEQISEIEGQAYVNANA